MKMNRLILALPLLGASSMALANTTHQRVFKPQAAIVERVHHHGVEHGHNEKAPIAQLQSQPQKFSMLMMRSQAATVSCDLNALANASSTSIITELKNQGSGCVNELFSASASTQSLVFSSDNMYAVANHAKSLSQTYAGGGDIELEALFLYLRAGFYAEFYNDNVSFSSWVTPAVIDAIDAFVNNSHFYDDNDGHGKTLSEVIITMDSAEQQHRYLYVVKQWLTRFNESYAAKWNIRSAVNGIFTLLYRGQWNDAFVTAVASDTDLVTKLNAFTQKQWMIDSDAQYLIVNAASELARLKQYSDTAIQATVDTGLKAVFSTYNSFGYGDAVWLAAADSVSYYADCNDYGICGFVDELTQQALSQNYSCSSTIKIRSQNMTAAQHTAACAAMGAEEGLFHTKLATNNAPVADDNNSFLQVNIFDSSDDYSKYAGAIFGINTNNGGMYLEGDPAVVGNQANFIAYEASYANAEHYVWNLEHEYVHYLDGRFDLYGNFNSPTEDIVWWSEGVAEYVANLDNNDAAKNTISDGSRYTLAQVFATNYDGFDQDRIYRWGYLAVRFMFERHYSEINAMLADTRIGNWSAYKAKTVQWANNYENEFVQWCDDLVAGTTTNTPPIAYINGPYAGMQNNEINFTSNGSIDSDGSIVSYQWSFGDGSSSNQANPVHTYTTSGQYSVSLTVVDNQGASQTASTLASIEEDSSVGNGELINAQPMTIAGEQDELLYFSFDVPQGASDLVFSLSGGTGDADLYVSYAATPTMDSYDCRPYVGGNSEQCVINPAQAGVYQVMIRGYNMFDNVKLTASYTGVSSSVPDACATQGSRSNGRLNDGEVICLGNSDPMWFSIADVQSQSGVAITTANGSGDISLSYSNSSWPNGSNEQAQSSNSGNSECIYISDQSQYWGYLKVSGNSTGASLVVDFNSQGCR
ncbi:collagenase [Pseudoalteromonas sp. SR44-5]|uniref:collagenase n=1 Tax=unclassified Pseudoalteromonas TaxID=194690 RepID=UPI001602C1A1|nr:MULTISPECIES: collagenase [unclassified Pseudoalteromonas]MBB1332002.1 collagenase [Pseudoalteromonas sp. SR41-6]MBB1340771.1 collagenase [Pseudoalteromonas sp. SR45-6]MBB1365799.1 collagenase [Pseudoalteromonas sp. SR44-5]MBB1416740.1 collagenase [Pseudoalteromonas sp. SG44-1]MBB1420594.1 collagenase [Pseudoalteromonas sp. SG43-7]